MAQTKKDVNKIITVLFLILCVLSFILFVAILMLPRFSSMERSIARLIFSSLAIAAILSAGYRVLRSRKSSIPQYAIKSFANAGNFPECTFLCENGNLYCETGDVLTVSVPPYNDGTVPSLSMRIVLGEKAFLVASKDTLTDDTIICPETELDFLHFAEERAGAVTDTKLRFMYFCTYDEEESEYFINELAYRKEKVYPIKTTEIYPTDSPFYYYVGKPIAHGFGAPVLLKKRKMNTDKTLLAINRGTTAALTPDGAFWADYERGESHEIQFDF